MKNTHHKYIVFALLFSLMLVTSCKTKKVSLIDSGGILKAKSHEEVINDILAHELDYKRITTKGSINLKGKKVTAIFKIIKDEILQVSIRPLLGVEMMRIDITPEKAVLIDRFEGRYAEFSLKDNDIINMAAFNFHNLQALLTNQLFIAGKNKVTKQDYNKFDIGAENDVYALKTKDKNGINYNFSVDASDRITSALMTVPAKEITLLFNYNQFVEDKNSIYPTDMVANLAVKKEKMTVGISYSHLDINTDFNVDTSVSSKYKKVDIQDLLSAYMKIK